ncbi:MAG: hypothetical protein A4E52_01716 [Pelotomaculum sp. PtaB.Bin013]|nr:MAG: hypothetical protein A4E52_01716 [Pelotomaculum sp. PtaB.Bin013]
MKENMDMIAAGYAQMIVKGIEIQKQEEDDGLQKLRQAENHVTKSLGILQENGLYAFFLYQDVETVFGKRISSCCRSLLEEQPIALLKSGDDFYKDLMALCSGLDRLFLAKELIERVLVYARYHLKAGRKKSNNPGGEMN